MASVPGLADRKASCFLVTNDEMDNAIWRGDEKAIEILAQLLHFIAARDAVHF
jgi:hypothetical protein